MSDKGTNKYSPVPQKRRGNRRASNDSPFQDRLEPKIGVETANAPSSQNQQDDGYTRWLKEQKPPHWG